MTRTRPRSTPLDEVRPMRRRHGWVGRLRPMLGMSLLLASASVTLVSPPPAAAMGASDFTDAHGTYRLPSGEILTLFGRHPMLELKGEEVHLLPDGPGRFVADSAPLDVITLHQDAGGRTVGVSFERPGEPSRLATPVELHREREVRYASGDEELAGTLLMPAAPGPHPAVAIVHGAELGTRETYRLLASHLARRGVAVLIYDKRGTGASSGSFASATFDDLTADALAGVALLRREPGIDPDRLGLVGMSQGGWIIADAAVRSDEVAFLVALSASGFTPAEQSAWLTGNMLAVRGFEQRAIDASAKAWGMLYTSLDLVAAGVMSPMPQLPGFWFHALDPHLETVSMWEGVRQPVLALWGELDCQVPARDSLARLRGALERGPNRVHELRILAGADHGLALVGPCAREIGATHGGRQRYADGYLSSSAEWILGLDPDAESRSVSLPPAPTEGVLGWHQPPATQVPAHGGLLPQLAVLLLLLVVHGSMAFAWGAGWLAAIVRRRSGRRSLQARLRGLAGISGLAAAVAGALALVELLMLADLMSAPLVGGPTVEGASPVFSATIALTSLALLLGVAALLAEARARGIRRPGFLVATLPVVLLAGWAAYWGFLPLPAVGLG